jgi:chain length determinant protein EpsF
MWRRLHYVAWSRSDRILEAMTFLQFLDVLRARWRVVATVLVVSVLTALAATLIMPAKYAASASVVLDDMPDPVNAGGNNQTAAYMQTQEDIAASQRVAERVVKSLPANVVDPFRKTWQEHTGGRGDFTAWLASILRRHVYVPVTPESNVLTIVANWPDAKSAADLANAFAQAYIDTTIELKMQPAKEYARLFDENSRALRADLEAKQKALSDFENAHGLIVSDARMDVENARLAELSSQLVAVQGQLHDSQSRQRAVSGGDESRPEILQSTLIAGLKSDLSLAQAKQRDLATQLGVNHPDYKRNQAIIDSLKDRIAAESAKVVSSLDATSEVNLHRQSELAAALAAQKARVLELKHQRDQGAELQNDVITAQRNLDAVTQRLAQSNLQSQTPQSNIALLTPATEPLGPYSPSFYMNGVVGVILGLVVGIGTALLLERTDRRVRSDAELVQLLGLPILGRISAVSGRRRSRRLLRPALSSRKAVNS